MVARFKIALVVLVLVGYCAYGNAETRGEKKIYETAMKFAKNKRLQEADVIFSMGLKKYPKSIFLLYSRAKHRHNYLEDFHGAINDYSKVIKMNPRYNPKAFWRRGDCFYRLGMYSLAIKDYNRCLSMVPNYDKVYYLRAKAYGRVGLYAYAKKDLGYLLKKKSEYYDMAKRLLVEISTKGSGFEER